MNLLIMILTLVANIVGGLSDSAKVTQVINTLIQIVNLASKEIETIAPQIENIIAALRTNDAITAEQMAQLKQLDAAVDAAFDAAAKDV